MDSLRIPLSCGVVNGIKSAFTFEWIIKDFITICDKVKPMKFIRSPIFPTGITNEHRCYIKLFPNGDKKENEGFLCIYIQYVNEDGGEEIVNKGVMAGSCQFNLLNSNYQVYKSLTTTKDKSVIKGGRLIEQNIILNKLNGILVFGAIKFTCEVTEETKADYEKLFMGMKIQTRLKELDNFEKLLEKEEHSDVVIVVEDKKIHAHKCILSTKSSVFAAMFEHDMKEKKENIVEIPEFTFKVIRELLRFVYVGKVGDIKVLALDLYEAADMYDLESLKVICEEVMCENLSVKNVFDYLKFTLLYKEAKKLKALAIDFIALHAEVLKPVC